jgi:hypothetical protein
VFALVALLPPAIQKMREAARRTKSMNHLQQLGIAFHSYMDAKVYFPPGNDMNNFSTSAYLLPYIEQADLHGRIDFKKSITDKANSAARAVHVKTFESPRDSISSVNADWGPTNYLFCAGSRASLDMNDGVCYQGSRIKIDSITDGTSNTILVGETLKGDGLNRATTVARQYVLLKNRDAEEKINDKSGLLEWKASRNIRGDRCASWMDGRFLQGTFNTARQPNDPRPDVVVEGGFGGLSGLRNDSGIILVGFCDASAHAISVGIKPSVWRALSTRAGGEVVDPSEF